MFKGFKTFAHCAWISTVGVVLMCKDQLDAFGINISQVVGQYVPTQYVGAVLLGIAVLFAYMRYISTTPPFRSE